MHSVLVEMAVVLAVAVLEGGFGRRTMDHSGQLFLLPAVEHLGVGGIDC